MITKSIGSYGDQEGNFKGPRGIAIEPSSQNIYIVDSINCRVQVFSKDLIYEFSFPQAGDSARLNLPWGICIKDSLVFITASSIDYFERQAEHGFYVYTIDGILITKINRYTVREREMKLNVPQGIAVDSENNVYIADFNNSRVIAYYVSLPLYSVIVANANPRNVYLHSKMLYILLSNGKVIRKGLDKETEIEKIINCKRNSCSAEFFSVLDDKVYVCDQKRNQIIEYSIENGEMTRTIGQSDSFTHIKGLAFDKQSNVLISVCENERNRLKRILL